MIRDAVLRAPSGTQVTLVGGILGQAEDAALVRQRLEARPVGAVLLGIPFEDLDAVRSTLGQELKQEFDRDTEDDLYFRELAKFGPVQVPPGDLYAAFEFASSRGLPIEAIDLGDEGHTAVYTEHVGIFEIMKQNRRRRNLSKETFGAKNPEDFAQEWDHKLAPTKGLRRVQVEREVWMAKRIAELAKTSNDLFALVPLVRWPGVRDRLRSDHGFSGVA